MHQREGLFSRLCRVRGKCKVSLLARTTNRVARQWVRHLAHYERHIEIKRLEDTYRIEVQSVSRFLVLIHPWHTFAAHFRQPVPPHQHCHLCKVTSSSDGRTKIDSYCVVHTSIATCPAVSTPLPVAIERDKCSAVRQSCLSLGLCL